MREIDSETEDGNRQIECEAEMREAGRERGGDGGREGVRGERVGRGGLRTGGYTAGERYVYSGVLLRLKLVRPSR